MNVSNSAHRMIITSPKDITQRNNQAIYRWHEQRRTLPCYTAMNIHNNNSAEKRCIWKNILTHSPRCRSTAGLCWSLWSCPSRPDSSQLCCKGSAWARSRARALGEIQHNGGWLTHKTCANHGLNHIASWKKRQTCFYLRGIRAPIHMWQRGRRLIFKKTKHVWAKARGSVWVTRLMTMH